MASKCNILIAVAVALATVAEAMFVLIVTVALSPLPNRFHSLGKVRGLLFFGQQTCGAFGVFDFELKAIGNDFTLEIIF